jgi:hypothetical protein
MSGAALEEYYLEELRLASEMDVEACHVRADEILCAVLRRLNFNRLVREYERLPKWHA